jgi:hypothetical protein
VILNGQGAEMLAGVLAGGGVAVLFVLLYRLSERWGHR